MQQFRRLLAILSVALFALISCGATPPGSSPTAAAPPPDQPAPAPISHPDFQPLSAAPTKLHASVQLTRRITPAGDFIEDTHNYCDDLECYSENDHDRSNRVPLITTYSISNRPTADRVSLRNNVILRPDDLPLSSDPDAPVNAYRTIARGHYSDSLVQRITPDFFTYNADSFGKNPPNQHDIVAYAKGELSPASTDVPSGTWTGTAIALDLATEPSVHFIADATLKVTAGDASFRTSPFEPEASGIEPISLAGIPVHNGNNPFNHPDYPTA